MDSVPEENGFPKISIGIGILVLELSFLEPFLFDEVKRDGNNLLCRFYTQGFHGLGNT